MRRVALFAITLLFATPAFAADKKPVNRRGLDFFEAKIRPVLVKHCYQCHSAEAAAKGKLKGALYLDTRGGLLKGGDSGPALVPGKPKQGLLISALKHDAFKMPPKGKLPARIIADFEKWVKMGAPDPRDGGKATTTVETNFKEARKFWSFSPIKKVTIPKVKETAWVRNSVDNFVRAKQEAKSLSPNGPASPETLIRRVYFDTIGLPPSPAEIEKFVRDAEIDITGAYRKLVADLLKRKQFGEKWARHWLDVARFAESNGYAFDGDRPFAFHYRDFVIRAINDDLPYDQFIRLQVAGDLIAPTLKQLGPKPGTISQLDAYSATGFIVAGPYTTQQTMKERERSRYEQLDDMIHTIGTSMLGLTVGCARCHSHKYDPLPQRDYYRVAASFADVGFTNVPLNLELAKFQKAKAAHDKIVAPLLSARTKYEKGPFKSVVKDFLKNGLKSLPIKSSVWHHIGPYTAANFDKAFATPFPPQKQKTIDVKKPLGKLKWKAQPTWVDGKIHNTLSGTNAANYLYRTIESKISRKVTLFFGKDDAIEVWLNGKRVLSKKSSGGVVANQEKVPVKLREGVNHLLVKIINQGGPSGFYFRTNDTPPAAIVNLLKAGEKKWNAKQRTQVESYIKTTDKQWLALNAKVVAEQKRAPKPKITTVFSAKTRGTTYKFGGNTYKVYFLNRGNVDNKQAEAKPGFLRLLATSSESRWLNAKKQPRMALADWLSDTDHGAGHLLARVVVNRLWYHYFGTGIVATPSDFGTRGERPSHPQLLDYLAGKLIEGGWKLKPIHHLILTSASYMQDTNVSDRNHQIDPDNTLVWRRVPRRLEAEVIRDALLQVCGKLDTRMFGKGTLNQADGRRSVYLTVKRSRLIPLLQLFDAPDTMQGVGKRELSTVAPQALTLLNSSLVRNLAGNFASQLQAKGKKTTVELVKSGYQTALGRSPSKDEASQMAAFIEQQIKSRPDNKQAIQLAVQDFCHLLLCMNEFVYVD